MNQLYYPQQTTNYPLVYQEERNGYKYTVVDIDQLRTYNSSMVQNRINSINQNF
jgi:hypothetical protein